MDSVQSIVPLNVSKSPQRTVLLPTVDAYILQTLQEQSHILNESDLIQITSDLTVPFKPIQTASIEPNVSSDQIHNRDELSLSETQLGYVVGAGYPIVGWLGSILDNATLQKLLPHDRISRFGALPGLTAGLRAQLADPDTSETIGPSLLYALYAPSASISATESDRISVRTAFNQTDRNSPTNRLRARYGGVQTKPVKIVLRDYNWITSELIDPITKQLVRLNSESIQLQVILLSDREGINSGCGRLYRRLKALGIYVKVLTNYTRVPGYHDYITRLQSNTIFIASFHELTELTQLT